jgi:hypothetical protein
LVKKKKKKKKKKSKLEATNLLLFSWFSCKLHLFDNLNLCL